MTCSDVDRILPDILEGPTGDGSRTNGDQDPEFQSHLKSCPQCAELVADLKLIASEARKLASAEEPPSRVWVNVAAQLRAEGLIREPEAAGSRPVLVTAPRRRWSALWFAPVAVAILAAGSYLLNHRSAAPTAPQAAKGTNAAQVPAQAGQSTAQQSITPQTSAPATQQEPPEEAEISAPAEDQEFLSEVSSRAPTMRATYENQLHAVNVEIQETQAYIDQNPGDVDARQHLLDVYQQKAMLYQMALDRIQ